MKRMVEVMTKERPILFSTAMVKALLEGRKTQTRRTRGLNFINQTPDDWEEVIQRKDGKWYAVCDDYEGNYYHEVTNPYGNVSDVLWVRESWNKLTEPDSCGAYLYKANGDTGKMKPSIHMPRAACRIRLEITDIRVERLQDISEDDAKAEGATPFFKVDAADFLRNPKLDFDKISTHKNGFENIWQKINGEESWNQNPWVWCISFKKL